MNKFEEIQHEPLRAYNRAVMFYNIYEDAGRAAAEDYANLFSKEDRLKMAQVVALVKRKGVKFVRDLVTNGVDFPLNRPTNYDQI
jgi:hypothetical protein